MMKRHEIECERQEPKKRNRGDVLRDVIRHGQRQPTAHRRQREPQELLRGPRFRRSERLILRQAQDER